MRGWFRRRSQPFDFSQGVPAPGRYPPDGLDVDQAMDAIRDAPVEIGFGFDAEMRQVFRQVGDEENLWSFHAADVGRIRDGLFFHNHPPYLGIPEGDPRRRAGSFSDLDVMFMTYHGIAKARVVTAERTYHLRRLPQGFLIPAEDVATEYRFLTDLVVSQLLRRGYAAEYAASLRGIIADETMLRLAATGGDRLFDYWWEAMVPNVGSPGR